MFLLGQVELHEPVAWSEALAVGHPELDRHHRELLQALERFHEAMRCDPVCWEAFLATFEHEVEELFAEEQELLRHLEPQQALAHRQAHRRLLGELGYRRRQAAHAEPEGWLRRSMFAWLSGWITSHVLIHNVELVAEGGQARP